MAILKNIHEAGFVYNDLKLDNLLFDFDLMNVEDLNTTNIDIFEKMNINIIDYGFATPYLEKLTKRHIIVSNIGTFRGNIVFSSVNQLNFKTTSRRDDIISLFYLLIYLLHDG